MDADSAHVNEVAPGCWTPAVARLRRTTLRLERGSGTSFLARSSGWRGPRSSCSGRGRPRAAADGPHGGWIGRTGCCQVITIMSFMVMAVAFRREKAALSAILPAPRLRKAATDLGGISTQGVSLGP